MTREEALKWFEKNMRHVTMPGAHAAHEAAIAALRGTYDLDNDPEIITNADRIRAMSDEELAEFIARPCSCTVAPECDGYRECGNDLCLNHLLTWLQSPEGEIAK